MAKKSKPQARKKSSKDLSPRDARHVKGGKAGKDHHEYLIVKLNEVLISGVSPSGK